MKSSRFRIGEHKDRAFKTTKNMSPLTTQPGISDKIVTTATTSMITDIPRTTKNMSPLTTQPRISDKIVTATTTGMTTKNMSPLTTQPRISDKIVTATTTGMTTKNMSPLTTQPGISDKIVTATTTGMTTTKMTPAVEVETEEDRVVVERVTTWLKQRLSQNTTADKFAIRKNCKVNSTLQTACIPNDCPQLSDDPGVRVKSLLSSPKQRLTTSQHEIIGSLAEQVPENDIIILTGSSANHFDETQAMFQSLHKWVYPTLKNFSVVLWDLGLTAQQRDTACILKARKYAIWHDASIRFKTFPGPLYERADKAGLQVLRSKVGTSIPYRTLPEMFTYMGQKPCSFYQYPEIASGFGVYKNDPFVLQAVSDPWARCAFEAQCMCSRHYLKSYRCHFGPCHRFDQSALGIAVHTLYAQEAYRVIISEEVDRRQYFAVHRGEKNPYYFQSLGGLSN